jgi:WD40 repeat protein
VRQVAFSPNGEVIASLESDLLLDDVASGETDERQRKHGVPAKAKIRIWDAKKLMLQNELKGHDSLVTCIAFSPDGNYLAAAGMDDIVRLWSVESGAVVLRFSSRAGGILSIAFSPIGDWLATGTVSGRLLLWEIGAFLAQHRECSLTLSGDRRVQ